VAVRARLAGVAYHRVGSACMTDDLALVVELPTLRSRPLALAGALPIGRWRFLGVPRQAHRNLLYLTKSFN